MAKLMSDQLKYELAHELGVDHILRANGGDWGEVPSRKCGELVQAAIRVAEAELARRRNGGTTF